MKEINWRGHLIELAVVIIGILIAFQLNNWAQKKNNRKLIDEHLAALERETDENIYLLKKARELAELNLSYTDTIFNHIMSAPNVKKVTQLTVQLLTLGNAYIKKNAYNTLIQSGDIRLIKNYQQKDRIINLYEYYDWVNTFDERHLLFYKENFYPFVMKNIDLVSLTPDKPQSFTSRNYRNLIGSYQFNLKQRIAKYDDCISVMERYLGVEE